MGTKKKLLLIDGHSVAFRAFYALHSQLERMKNKSGLHTNALYGFHNMLKNVMEKELPSHAMVAFDAGKTTFRHAYFADYKGGRDTMPQELSEQIPYLNDMLDGFGIAHYELENYEADDILGTLSRQAEKQGFEVVIITGDRDLTQLVTDHITVDFTNKGVTDLTEVTPAHLEEKLGLTPQQITDYKGLMGDASDNIPGVSGIGEKRAQKLLHEYGTVENLYDNIDNMKKSKMKDNLIAQKDIALLSKKLATINVESPLTIGIDDLNYHGKNTEKLIHFYKEMNFNSQLEKMDIATEDMQKVVDPTDYEFLKQIEAKHFEKVDSLYVEMLSPNYHQAPIAVVAWGNSDHAYLTDIETAKHSSIFKTWAEDSNQKKITFDAKSDIVALHKRDITLEGVSFDLSLASYLLTANDNSADVADVAQAYGYDALQADVAVYGKGKSISIPSDVEIMYQHVANKISAISYLAQVLNEQLIKNDQEDLLMHIELPLSFVLAKMELRGVTVDISALHSLKKELQARLDQIEQDIYKKAGEVFNINSPKQLSYILFEKLGYPVIRKTKTGYSTAQDVLEKLQAQAPIVDDILQYRQLNKIQSTYVEGLLKVVDRDQKVHTRFMQTVARTGRLSSVDPNLQNIPVRSEDGRNIRKVFKANHPNWYIFSSDYSQIELRVMAHISEDEHLINAFKHGEDIHNATARRIFALTDTDEVTANMRRDAKAINFGIMYGMSDYGLSENLGISRKAAKDYIATYFKQYPGVAKYMDDIVRDARDKGYVETIFHRRRYLDDINSRNFNQRSFAERTAMNTPIQGSAADIIKIAMVEVEKRLADEDLQSKMLLQVHDELILEVPESELDIISKILPTVMENVVSLAVPLKVASSFGKTWYDA